MMLFSSHLFSVRTVELGKATKNIASGSNASSTNPSPTPSVALAGASAAARRK
jgi:hypothetical protein